MGEDLLCFMPKRGGAHGDSAADSRASVVRSLRLVQESEVVGTETAKLVHSQTEQLKDIHADAQTLQAEISRANSLLVRMGRRAWTDRLTRALLILISIGICACVA